MCDPGFCRPGFPYVARTWERDNVEGLPGLAGFTVRAFHAVQEQVYDAVDGHDPNTC
jgi:hypothetical protein